MGLLRLFKRGNVTIMIQFKKLSVPICIKTFGGTALCITFMWWTIVSFIKYKGEPTSTEINFTVGDGELDTENINEVFPEMFDSDVLGRNGIFFPQLTMCNKNFVQENPVLSKCSNGSNNFLTALSNCLKIDPSFTTEKLTQSFQTDHRIYFQSPVLLYGVHKIVPLNNLDDIIWSNVYHRRFGLCFNLDLSDTVSHD